MKDLQEIDTENSLAERNAETLPPSVLHAPPTRRNQTFIASIAASSMTGAKRNSCAFLGGRCPQL
jgi:hypothetical protein